MSVHDGVVDYRMRLVAVIEASSNRRAACAAAGIHPSSFYRWRKQPWQQRRRVSWAAQQLEQQIVAAALGSPALGPQPLAAALNAAGFTVTTSKVWRTLKRHRLNTRRLRYGLLGQHRVTPSITISSRAKTYVGRLAAERPGDLVQMDCFHVGSFKETRMGQAKNRHGQIWQYTAIDVASSWVWAELHTTAHNPSPAITSALAHRVAADLTQSGWKWRAATTDNGNEYRAAQFRATLTELGIDHRFIRAGRPQTNGKVERVQRTLLEELYQPALIGYVEPSITGLRQDLTDYLNHYNWQRPHHGRWNKGQPPATIMIPNPKLHP